MPELRFGYVRFQSGVGPVNVFAALYGSLTGLGLVTFMGFALPYVLLEKLRMPPEQVGRLTGLLGSWHEIVLLCTLGLVGVLVDRHGRRLLFMTGFALIAATYIWFVGVSSLPELIAARTVYAIGACIILVMLGLLTMDFPVESDRGKWIGAVAVLQGLGVLGSALGLTKLPALLAGAGLASASATHATFLVVAALCLASSLALWIGFSGFAPAQREPRQSTSWATLLQGLTLARDNPRVLLAYACSVVSRADLVVVTTFFTLWVQQQVREQGGSPAEALARAGLMFATIQGVALVWGPVWGFVLDRLDRTLALATALGIAGFGYVWLGSRADPTDLVGYAACVATGIGQISVLLSVLAVIGEEAPRESRGVVTGVSNMFGALGMLGTAAIGGFLYDLVSKPAPIVTFGLLNLVVLLPAWLVWRRSGRNMRRVRELATR